MVLFLLIFNTHLIIHKCVYLYQYKTAESSEEVADPEQRRKEDTTMDKRGERGEFLPNEIVSNSHKGGERIGWFVSEAEMLTPLLPPVTYCLSMSVATWQQNDRKIKLVSN